MTIPDRTHVYRGTHQALVVSLFFNGEAGHASVMVCREEVRKGVPHRHLEHRFSMEVTDEMLSLHSLLEHAAAVLSRTAQQY